MVRIWNRDILAASLAGEDDKLGGEMVVKVSDGE